MLPSGLQETSSVVVNDSVPIITFGEQPTPFAPLGEENRPLPWSAWRYEAPSVSHLCLPPPTPAALTSIDITRAKQLSCGCYALGHFGHNRYRISGSIFHLGPNSG